MRTNITDDDMASAVAFIDGAMTVDERTRFELRLAAEPELAAALEALLQTDEVVRRAGRAESDAGRVLPFASHAKRSMWMWPVSLAAAALLVFGLVRWLDRESEPRVECLVALAPSFESSEQFIASRPTLDGLWPPGLGSLRGSAGGTNATNIGANDFVAKAHALEEKATGSASPAPIKAGYFVIPFEVKSTVSVVVLGVPSQGAPQRYFPELRDARPVDQQGRFAAGDHTLPRERIEVVEAPGGAVGVQYSRGFLVPVGAKEMRVLFAVRTQALDAELLKSIDVALTRGADRESLKKLLALNSFDVSELDVLEPND